MDLGYGDFFGISWVCVCFVFEDSVFDVVLVSLVYFMGLMVIVGGIGFVFGFFVVIVEVFVFELVEFVNSIDI